MSADRVLTGDSDVGGFCKGGQSSSDGSDANADVARLREQVCSGPFVRQFHRRIAGKIAENLLGHVSACSVVGDSQLRSNRCDSLSYEFSDWGPPDHELEMTELVGENVNKGFDWVLGFRLELVIEFVPPESLRSIDGVVRLGGHSIHQDIEVVLGSRQLHPIGVRAGTVEDALTVLVNDEFI